jgi:hypothetical protein
VSVAVSRDGAQVATGSSYDGNDEGDEGVVVWDVATGRMTKRVVVEGGVGIDDCLADGLGFSPDGTLLGVNFATNTVGIIDLATGALVFAPETDGGDSAPRWLFRDDGKPRTARPAPSAWCCPCADRRPPRSTCWRPTTPSGETPSRWGLTASPSSRAPRSRPGR